MDIEQQVQLQAEKAARELHPDLPNYEQISLAKARRGCTSSIKKNNILLGYGELMAEIADGDETLRAVRWKLGDGVHTWDELPDIPGPEYAFCCHREANIWPRNSIVKRPKRRIVYKKHRRGTAGDNKDCDMSISPELEQIITDIENAADAVRDATDAASLLQAKCDYIAATRERIILKLIAAIRKQEVSDAVTKCSHTD